MTLEAGYALSAIADKQIDDALNEQYPIGTKLRFTWMRDQKIGAEVIRPARSGALMVRLTETATTGVKRKGDQMVIPGRWITEKFA